MDEKKLQKTKTTTQTTPKIIYKGTQGFRHDLFKLQNATLKHNKSFKKGHVQLEEFDHCHFFHTFDSNGRPQKYSTATGGHFHEVKWYVDENGDFKGECGPAQKYEYVKRGGIQQKKIGAVKWNDEMNDSVVHDNHTHVCDYKFSEELSKDMIARRRNSMTSMASQQIAQDAHAKSLGMESGLE